MSYQENHAKMGLSTTLALILLPIWISAASAEFLKFAEDQDTGTVFGVSNYSHLMQHEPCLFNMPSKYIYGMVPKHLDLLDDSLVQDISRKAVRAFAKKCPQVASQPQRRQKQGAADPSFEITVNFYWPQSQYPEVIVYYTITIERALKRVGIQNYAKERAERAAAEETQRKAEQEERERVEAQRRAEQLRLAREQAEREAARQRRWNEFVQKYSVQELVKDSALFTNPFLYQGKTVAISIEFVRMIAANSGLFGGDGGSLFVVSNIPTGTFKSQRERDVLAVKFIGMTEVKGLPFVSSMQVPNLRFVGVHVCRYSRCEDILKDN